MLGAKVHFSDRENFSKIRATGYGGDVVHRRNILWCGDSKKLAGQRNNTF